MRHIFVSAVLLCVLCGTGFGEGSVYQVGLGGVYFFPRQSEINIGFSDKVGFNNLRGLGCELGRFSENYDLSLEAHWASAKSTSVKFNDYAIIYRVTPRVAYRFWKWRTPYIGAGYGYQLIHVHFDPDRWVDSPTEESHQTFAFEPFAGYDLGLTNRFGLKLEGRYQFVAPSEPSLASFVEGLRWSGGAYLAFGG